MINKIILYLLLFTFSFNCLASPYISSSSYRYSGSPSTGEGSFLFILLGAIAFFIYYKMALAWIDRKKNHLKPERFSDIGEWVMIFIMYAFLSMCASAFILLVLDFFWGKDLVRSVVFYVWFIFFAVALFLTIT